METFLGSGNYHRRGAVDSLKVPVLSVETIAKRCQLNKRFAILSIDAEGVGDRILHAWIEAGFRPEFIIYEAMHNKEELRVSKAYLSSNGYRFLETRRWNHYFQNIDRDSDTLASAGLGLTDEP